MNTKFCSYCQTEKPLTDFGKNKSKRDGLQTYCIICKQDFNKKAYIANPTYFADKKRAAAKLIREKVATIKTNAGCFCCREDDECCLDFHHFDQKTKKDSVSNLINDGSLRQVMVEIAKCVILCANCHRKSHGGKLKLVNHHGSAPCFRS